VYVKCRNESQYGSSRLEIHMQNNLSSTVGNYSTTLGKRAWQLFVLDAALEKLAWSKRCVSITDVFNSQDGFSNFMNLLQGSSKFFFSFFFTSVHPRLKMMHDQHVQPLVNWLVIMLELKLVGQRESASIPFCLGVFEPFLEVPLPLIVFSPSLPNLIVFLPTH